VGKCYEHIEATRSVGDYEYYSTDQPKYVGKYVRTERYGWGDAEKSIAIFDDNGKENRVNYSYEGNTCFKEVPCKTSGGKRKTRRMRKKSKKSRRRRN
jgi:hypothetical protein